MEHPTIKQLKKAIKKLQEVEKLTKSISYIKTVSDDKIIHHFDFLVIQILNADIQINSMSKDDLKSFDKKCEKLLFIIDNI